MDINKVCVIGAGVMGASIAAHVTNAGCEVLLFDLPTESDDRDMLARQAINQLLKAKPAPFSDPRNARLITPLNTQDNLSLIADCDWIIEAVVERLDVKQALYIQIQQHKKPDAIVSSNTSTLPLASLIDGLSDNFCQKFCITHFFNPPRYMRLLEIVSGSKTARSTTDTIEKYCDYRLGKSIIHCKDTPGFVANRLGVYWIYCALVEAIDCGMSIEEADAILSKPCGVPKTGVFALMDLVGLDLIPNVVNSMLHLLPANDPFIKIKRDLPLLREMIENGYTGRKGKGGFYRMRNHEGVKIKEAINLATGEYHRVAKVDLQSAKLKVNDLKNLFETNDKGGDYAWRVMSKTLAYAAMLVPQAASDITVIDEAMRTGYNWKYGPFELIDMLGADWLVNKLHKESEYVPPLLQNALGKSFYRQQDQHFQFLTTLEHKSTAKYTVFKRASGMLMLADIKRYSSSIIENSSAALWDIGDGVLCFEFTSKMNTLDANTMHLLQQSIIQVQTHYKALVIYNDADNFSAGANLGMAMFAANIAAWSEISNIVLAGQQAYKALKYAPFPVVSAPFGMAIGGGCEILLHSDAVQAHIETYTGLVEVAVGLVPAWGGCKEMLHRWTHNPQNARGPMPGPSKAFELISTATVSASAQEAKANRVMRPSDGITMNRYRLLADAKQKALELAVNYTPPAALVFNLPGPSAKVVFSMVIDSFVRSGKATEHDGVVSLAVADVLSGGEFADPNIAFCEDQVLALEHESFMKIIRHPRSLDRVEHILLTAKPLRN